MHSRIFQLTKEPVAKNEWLTEEDFFESDFIGSVADYVKTQPEIERQEDVEWLVQGTKGIFALEGEKVRVLPGAKHAYFAERYNQFKEKADSLTLDDFCCGNGTWELCETIQEKFSFYIYDEYGGWKPLDLFVREVEEGDVFYIGGIVDYHF